MTFYQDLRIKTRPQLKKNGKLKRKEYIVLPFKFSSFFSKESTGKSKRIHYISLIF